MASYFDTTDSDHTDLLPDGVRTATDLVTVAALAEAEVISRFTDVVPAGYPILVDPVPYGGVKIDDYRYVYLRGYTIDADDADVGADLKVALRRTIAVVLTRALRMWEKDERILSEKGKTFRASAASKFPKGWDSLLRPFDTLPKPYAL